MTSVSTPLKKFEDLFRNVEFEKEGVTFGKRRLVGISTNFEKDDQSLVGFSSAFETEIRSLGNAEFVPE